MLHNVQNHDSKISISSVQNICHKLKAEIISWEFHMQFDLISHVNSFTGLTSEVQEGHRIWSTSIDKLKLLLKSMGALVLEVLFIVHEKDAYSPNSVAQRKLDWFQIGWASLQAVSPGALEYGCVSSRHICEKWTQKHKYWVENRHLLHCEVMICTFPPAEGAGIPNIQNSPEAFGKVCTHKHLKPQIHQIPSELWS